MKKQWKVREKDAATIEKISKDFFVPKLLARVIYNRGIVKPADISNLFLAKLENIEDPFHLKDIEKAAKRIIKAIEENEKIVVFGDFDVDGITATSLLITFFREIGTEAFYYIPERAKDGYDIKASHIEYFKKENFKLIITVDCGISACEAAKKAKELGIDLIITDHHEIGEDLPQAYSIINPKQIDCDFTEENLSGVGVAFYLVIAIRKILKDKDYFKNREVPNLRRYLDLVALGTIADISPALGINRILIKYGLAELEQSLRPGINALKEVSGILGRKVNYGTVAFALAPRLNAGGRLGDAKRSVNLLISDNAHESKKIASILDKENKERQKIEKDIFENAVKKIERDDVVAQRYTIVLGSKKWHEGVIGIVASKLVEKYYRPVILFAFKEDNSGKGSARSITSLHIYDAISKCSDLLVSFGGHKYAAGLSIKNDNFEKFADKFEEIVRSKLNEEDLIPILDIDENVNLSEIDYVTVKDLTRLEPYGPSNPEPVFSANQIEVYDKSIVGKDHLKLKLKQDGKLFNAIGFRLGQKKEKMTNKVNIAFCPFINYFNGNVSVELKIKDIEAVEE